MATRRRELGKRIAEARKEKRWKQKQLAAAVHVEPTTVSRWENGRHAPNLDMLELVAQVTDKPLSFFVDEVMRGTGQGDGAEIRQVVRDAVREILVEEQFPRLEAIATSVEDHFVATASRLDALEVQLRSLRRRRGGEGER